MLINTLITIAFAYYLVYIFVQFNFCILMLLLIYYFNKKKNIINNTPLINNTKIINKLYNYALYNQIVSYKTRIIQYDALIQLILIISLIKGIYSWNLILIIIFIIKSNNVFILIPFFTIPLSLEPYYDLF